MAIARPFMKGVSYYNNVFKKNNFDYFLKDIRTEYLTHETYNQDVRSKPFYQKVILNKDISETYGVIKIGDCFIEYSYQTATWGEQLVRAFDNLKIHYLGELIKHTKNSHNKSPSVYLKKINGKETGDVT